jgi:hypothetical protein
VDVRPRKAEVEAMVRLLDNPADDVETLAKEVLGLAWALADARDRVGVVIDQPGVAVTLHGPFDSVTQAHRFLDVFPFAGPARPRVKVSRLSAKVDTTVKVTA